MLTWWEWWMKNGEKWEDRMWNYFENNCGILAGLIGENNFKATTEQLWAIREGLAEKP